MNGNGSEEKPTGPSGLVLHSLHALEFFSIHGLTFREEPKTILPLTLSHLEREGKTVYAKVYRVSFGYARLDRMDAPYQYKLVPVWDFFGVVDDDSRKEYASDHYSLLTINAMDGTVIDRAYGY